ncbi:MAG: hypothetical protein ACREOQ_02885, partial [Gemmatimonadales bacterium]
MPSPGQLPPFDPTPAFRATYLAGLDSLDQALQALARAPAPTAAEARSANRRARSAYKQVEYWIEYGRPDWLAALNGPPVRIPDEDDPDRVIIPA